MPDSTKNSRFCQLSEEIADALPVSEHHQPGKDEYDASAQRSGEVGIRVLDADLGEDGCDSGEEGG